MGHFNTNRVSAAITPAMVEDLSKAIDTIAGMLPFLVRVSDEERKGLHRLGKANKAYVADALSVAARHPELLPAWFPLGQLDDDFNSHNALEEVDKLISELAAKITDTRLLMGSEAYSAALVVYQNAGMATRVGLEAAIGARKELGGRFKAQGIRSRDGSKAKG